MALRSLLLSRDPDILRVFRRALDEFAIDVEVCTRGETGMEMLSRKKFDAVIVDCDDIALAVELLESVPKASSNKRAIVLAIINGITSMREAFALGGHFVLEKPVSMERATRCLRAAQGFMLAEQRRYFRYPFQTKVNLTLRRAQELTCTSTNISEGGMALKLAESVSGQDAVEVRFRLPGFAESIEAKGEFAWSDGQGNAGIRFVHMAADSRRMLTKWLAEEQKAEMDNGGGGESEVLRKTSSSATPGKQVAAAN